MSHLFQLFSDSLFRQQVALVPHYITTTLHYYHTTLLPHYITATLHYYYTTLLPHYITTTLHYYHTTLLPHYITATLHYYHTTSLPHYIMTTLHYYHTTLLPHYITTTLHYYYYIHCCIAGAFYACTVHTVRAYMQPCAMVCLDQSIGVYGCIHTINVIFVSVHMRWYKRQHTCTCAYVRICSSHFHKRQTCDVHMTYTYRVFFGIIMTWGGGQYHSGLMLCGILVLLLGYLSLCVCSCEVWGRQFSFIRWHLRLS